MAREIEVSSGLSSTEINSRGSSVNVENLALLEAEFDETLAHVDGAVLDLDKVEPLVLGELEILPRLLLDGLLAGNGLLDVLSSSMVSTMSRQPRALRVPCSRAL
jgi:hypothetical protein